MPEWDRLEQMAGALSEAAADLERLGHRGTVAKTVEVC